MPWLTVWDNTIFGLKKQSYDTGEIQALLETVRYDISFRQLCVERGNIPEGCLPFLLGRPLSETLVMFGLALTRNNNRMGLVRRGEGRYGGPVFPDGKDLYR
jgi:hypothetical protein